MELWKYVGATVALVWIGGGGLYWLLRRRYSDQFDRLGETSSEQMLDELEKEWKPRPAITLRTQAEYLPFVIESVREVVDRGLDDDKMICLQERFENSRPNESRTATFTVEAAGRTDTLQFDWRRDDSDRIEIRVRAAPPIIRALKAQRRKVPKSRPDTAAR